MRHPLVAGVRTEILGYSARNTGRGRIEDSPISRKNNTRGTRWKAINRSWRRRKPARWENARRAELAAL